MSGTETPTPPPGYTGPQIAAIVVGSILLLPGLCSLVFFLGMVWELRLSDPIAPMIVTLWVVCFLVSAGGVALIYGARKRRASAS
jgi:hypothetical protein